MIILTNMSTAVRITALRGSSPFTVPFAKNPIGSSASLASACKILEPPMMEPSAELNVAQNIPWYTSHLL